MRLWQALFGKRHVGQPEVTALVAPQKASIPTRGSRVSTTLLGGIPVKRLVLEIKARQEIIDNTPQDIRINKANTVLAFYPGKLRFTTNDSGEVVLTGDIGTTKGISGFGDLRKDLRSIQAKQLPEWEPPDELSWV